jgi:hypothetical protein
MKFKEYWKLLRLRTKIFLVAGIFPALFSAIFFILFFIAFVVWVFFGYDILAFMENRAALGLMSSIIIFIVESIFFFGSEMGEEMLECFEEFKKNN